MKTTEALDRLSTAMNEAIIRHGQLGNLIGTFATTYVAAYLDAHGLEQIAVDDENETPSYALTGNEDIDEDDDLNQAIGWLPRAAFTNSTPNAGWNPVVRRTDLEHILAGGEA